jgi:reactive intermediate/imine deaminase
MDQIQRLQPQGSPTPMGAYSHGIKVTLPGAELLFVAGQIALDAEGNVVAPGDAGKQAEVVFENIKRILEAGGMNIEHVVKDQVFLTNIADFPVVSAVRNKYFGSSKPVSTLLEVSRLVKIGCCIEVEVIAVKLLDENRR